MTSPSPDGVSAASAATLSGMHTSWPPDADLRAPAADWPGTPNLAQADPMITLPTWHLAACRRCGQDLSEPFINEIGRDMWAIDHAEESGHLVHLTVEPPDHEPMPDHPAVLLRCFTGRLWRWLCPSRSCAARPGGAPWWHGPYDTGQLALAAWRAHGRGQ